MSDIVKREEASVVFTQEQIQLLKSTVAPGLGSDEFKVFMAVCERKRLDPFQKQIYAVKRSGKMTLQTSIDGYRAIAARTGEYAGSDEPVFEVGEDGQPTKCTVTVYRLVQGHRCAFTASARWNEYYPDKGQAFMWDKMGYTMLGKVAEALALRKAFPEDTSGLYVEEEMDQASRGSVSVPPAKVIDVKVETPKTTTVSIPNDQEGRFFSGETPKPSKPEIQYKFVSKEDVARVREGFVRAKMKKGEAAKVISDLTGGKKPEDYTPQDLTNMIEFLGEAYEGSPPLASAEGEGGY